MKISVAGSGYVGLSLSILLAQHNDVTVVDIIDEKVRLINQGISPIKDADIEEYLKNAPLNLTASLDGASAYSNADLIIIATPTNYDSERNYFDTRHVEEVIEQVLDLNASATIVIKSTIPLGFIKHVREKYQTDRIIFSPEFLRESKALYDNLYPSRIIVSYEKDDSPRVIQAAKAFAGLLKEGAKSKDTPVLFMGSQEAEAVKLFANTFLAMRVSYFNELDTYSESKGLDAQRVIEGVCHDQRIGNHYNNPSFGYGGYCLPKDSKQLLANYRGIPQSLMSAIVESNKIRKSYLAEQILHMASNQKQPGLPLTIGFYRLIMKSNSDNFRESAIKDIIDIINDYGVNIVIYEPMLGEDIGYRVVKDLEQFKNESTIIVSNRFEDDLADVIDKVYTRDVFGRD
ncbi:TPA: nucleotide sugar dehydrogenase [Streptococcus equi subsp. zooepidemicus]|uniref:nucleotide sugar dehydrogenase n=1 Tax=Streptococcus equi TaxID=1336 RepID=UPI00197E74EA|nr:nucleotide sugar dehydrogenase [Streptococcus equi]QUQ79234.1 UDP-glucose 6-dehydrogenase [Streptococcus equi subsp. zooepidemicus]HEL1069953.1 nucleotide sugar dehydrogenase [Streptococcus equi subsp. zooepidemicus]HEL1136840.1 nucleotide sugar dehydrogenase [Streptococcus equi subsp. zooepidemicus]HEL1254958.1 nucleotide sugar dehydrogenase [Streptococcus equi subsp. zooepidemicus]HEL1276477.1 nucleotide sugar dehydrogenase [Streptococcus equi subsp. zooepidemicus]